MKSRAWRIQNLSDIPSFGFKGMKAKALVTEKETDRMSAYDIVFPPRLSIPPSYHKVAYEIIVIQGGRGTAHMNGKDVAVKAGDVLYIPPGVWHSFSTGKKSLKILAFLTPLVNTKNDFYYE